MLELDYLASHIAYPELYQSHDYIELILYVFQLMR